MVQRFLTELSRQPLLCLLQELRIELSAIQASYVVQDGVNQAHGIELPGRDGLLFGRIAGQVAFIIDFLCKDPHTANVAQNDMPVIGKVRRSETVTIPRLARNVQFCGNSCI